MQSWLRKVEYKVIYKNKTYTFQYGSEVYIFDTGLFNGIRSPKKLLEYVNLVESCYLKDSNRTPLGALADYIAQNWKLVKNLPLYDIWDMFYLEDF